MVVHAKFSNSSNQLSIDIDGHRLSPHCEMASYLDDNILLWANRFFELLDDEAQSNYTLQVYGLKFHYHIIQSQMSKSNLCINTEFKEIQSEFSAVDVLKELKMICHSYGIDTSDKDEITVCECASPNEKSSVFPNFVLTSPNNTANIRICLSEDDIKTSRANISIIEATSLRIENYGIRTRLYIPHDAIRSMMDYFNLYFSQLPCINKIISTLEKTPLKKKDSLNMSAIRESKSLLYCDDFPDEIDVGQTFKFEYCIVPSFVKNMSVHLIFDPSFLTNDSNGITAIQSGNTKIRIIDQNKNVLFEKEISIIRHHYATSISIVAPMNRNHFYPGETETLQIIPYPADAEDAHELHFELSDPEVAVVSTNGRLVTFKAGKCFLTVSGRKAKGELCIYVDEKLTKINLTASESHIMSDESCEIVASLEPKGAYSHSAKWSISPQHFGQLQISADTTKCTLVPNTRLQSVSNIFVTCEIDGVSEQTVVQVKPVDRREGLQITCILATIGAFLFCWTSLFNICLWVGLITCHMGKKNNRTGDQTYQKCFTANIIALILTIIITIIIASQ